MESLCFIAPVSMALRTVRCYSLRMAEITQTEVEDLAKEPSSASAGGRSATNRGPNELLEVKRKLDADTATAAGTFGIVLNRFKPGDAVG